MKSPVIAVHQPQYLPWIGYFSKLAASDLFVFLDNVQYKHREYQNRNRIKTRQGETWLTVPVNIKGKRESRLRSIEIDRSCGFQRKHVETLRHAYSGAPFFKEYFDPVRGLIESDAPSLCELNVVIVRGLLGLLGFSKLPEFRLESDLEIESAATDRIIDIVKSIGGATYLSGMGGKGYLETGKFGPAGIDLAYIEIEATPYRQEFDPPFIPNLSVVDLLFNAGADFAREYISGIYRIFT